MTQPPEARVEAAARAYDEAYFDDTYSGGARLVTDKLAAERVLAALRAQNLIYYADELQYAGRESGWVGDAILFRYRLVGGESMKGNA